MNYEVSIKLIVPEDWMLDTSIHLHGQEYSIGEDIERLLGERNGASVKAIVMGISESNGDRVYIVNVLHKGQTPSYYKGYSRKEAEDFVGYYTGREGVLKIQSNL